MKKPRHNLFKYYLVVVLLTTKIGYSQTCDPSCPGYTINEPSKYIITEYCTLGGGVDLHGKPACTDNCTLLQSCRPSTCDADFPYRTFCVCSNDGKTKVLAPTTLVTSCLEPSPSTSTSSSGTSSSTGSTTQIFNVGEMSNRNGVWTFANLSKGASPVAGSPFAYLPNGPRILYRGGEGNIYELSIDPSGKKWNSNNLTLASKAELAGGDPMGYVSNVARIVYRGKNNHIYEIFWSSNGWGSGDLTVGGQVALGNPFGYNPNGPRVLFRGQDKNIYELSIDPSGTKWNVNNLSGDSHSRLAGGDPMGFVSKVARVVYRGIDYHIYMIWWNGKWESKDISADNQLASGEPFGYDFNGPKVLYKGSDNNIYELSQSDNENSWNATNLTHITGASLASSNPMGYGSDKARVVYYGRDGQIHEISSAGANTWLHTKITDGPKSIYINGNPMAFNFDMDRVIFSWLNK